MSGKPSRVKQREIQQVFKGGFRAGATKISVHIGEATIVMHGNNAATTSTTVDLDRNEWLADDAH
jgi:ethanolamine utilization microcompartment shell protein EutL